MPYPPTMEGRRRRRDEYDERPSPPDGEGESGAEHHPVSRRRVTRRSLERNAEGGNSNEEATPTCTKLSSRLNALDPFELDSPASKHAMPPPLEALLAPPRLLSLSIPDDSRLRRLRSGGPSEATPRVCHLSQLGSSSDDLAAEQPALGSPDGVGLFADGSSSLRAPSRASIPFSLAGSLPMHSSPSRRSAAVETPPGPDKAFEAHAVLVACPAPRRRVSVLVRINGEP
jgi:hypothetical protein